VVAEDEIASAAVFTRLPGSNGLEFAAAAGIEGPAIDGLIVAVRNPEHPVTRAINDPGPTFDVRPMNPGGPALRSHLPLVVTRDGRRDVVGVLAVAHENPLSESARQSLEQLAADAADSIGTHLSRRGSTPSPS
jgi:hypothetical protein